MPAAGVRTRYDQGMSRQVRSVGDVRVGDLAWAGLLDTLEDVLHRGLHVVDVVVQDEYTHDVITSHGDAFLVFDTT